MYGNVFSGRRLALPGCGKRVTTRNVLDAHYIVAATSLCSGIFALAKVYMLQETTHKDSLR